MSREKIAYKRVNLELPPRLHAQFKRLALEEERTMSDIIREMIRHRVAVHAAEKSDES